MLPPLMQLCLWTCAGGRFAVVQGIAFPMWAGFTSWLFFAVVNAMIRLLPMAVTGLILNIIIFLIVARVTGDIIISISALCTSAGCLLFAVIKPSASYWAFGFPSEPICTSIESMYHVLLGSCTNALTAGANFSILSCSLFTAKIALPEEQSLAAGVFNILVQFGSAAGLAVTTFLYDQIAKKETVKIFGHPMVLTDSAAPRDVLLKGYCTTQWLNLAFLMAGLAVTTFLYDQIAKKETVKIFGHPMVLTDSAAPRDVLLKGYCTTQWLNLAFLMAGYMGHVKAKAASDQESQESSDDGEK
ncbi:hypothetical protein BOTBODRAFT_41578 [Botryobasidium botryosum FD-172 SS1]|uniref:Uncharacterized protein n=1 Tax=Botryobasidium botryosum (strain FD-172 SS1) TaxID=930990 RepID=A0A067N5F2_BOTB1|nr:hypothetical protein BOTBODRAFT_41578 [Botryobasidium botryosum FD-172 SS1]